MTAVVPAHRGQLRTFTWGPAAAGHRGGPAGLRSYLLADLVRRVGEQHRLLVSAWHAGEESGDAGRALKTDCGALNIHPLTFSPGPPTSVDIMIGEQPGPAGTRWLRGADARLPGDAPASPADGPLTAALTQRGFDPLALRLAFLRQPYREPVTLSWAELAAADDLLGRWRAQVAAWANSPSKPMCAQYTGDVKAAFDDDLDTPAALAALSALAADPEIPPGSKFESFAHLDHLLGLDLARDIGR